MQRRRGRDAPFGFAKGHSGGPGNAQGLAGSGRCGGIDVGEQLQDERPVEPEHRSSRAHCNRVASAHETTADEPDPTVKALPLLDPYVQGYRDRARFLDPARHDFVYDGGGNSTATLIRLGRIIGVWQFVEDPTGAVRYHLFDAVPASVRRSAEVDLAAAGDLYFARPTDVEAMATMKPLSADGGRSASHPLDSRLHRASRRSRG